VAAAATERQSSGPDVQRSPRPARSRPSGRSAGQGIATSIAGFSLPDAKSTPQRAQIEAAIRTRAVWWVAGLGWSASAVAAGVWWRIRL
jgi:hypothetical protein